MTGFFNSNISRKQFLETTVKMAGLAVTMRYPYTITPDSKDVHLALLSDTHVAANSSETYRGFFPGRNLERVLEGVQNSDALEMVICGDVARLEGKLGDYAAVKDKLDSMNKKLPLYISLGNHDDRKNFLNVFDPASNGAIEISNKHVTVTEYEPGARLIKSSVEAPVSQS